MALPIKTHCDRCGYAQWLFVPLAERVRRLECPRCGHRASTAALKLIRERARERQQPQLRLAS
ncbi:MAG: hypothetical protein ACYDGR_00125 [Candidatus Dormibacteria bacterium]